jgi:hypothetical protein
MLTRLQRWTCALAAGLMLSWSVPAAAATPDKLLPGDTFMVLNVDVQQLVASDVAKKYALEEIRSAIKKNVQASEILNVLNFDPLKDLNSITLAVGGNLPVPGGPGGDVVPDALAIVRGKFDLERVHGALAEVAKNMPGMLAVSEHGKFKVYETKEGPTPAYVAFLDGQTLVGSPKKSLVTDALDRSQRGSSAVKKEMAAALEKADAKQTMWLAMNFPESIKELMKAQPQSAAMADKLESMTAGVTVRDNVIAEIGIHTNDADIAKKLAAGVEQGKQALGFLALQNKEIAPIVMDVIPTIKATSQNTSVVIKAELSPATIEKLVKAAKEQNKTDK